MQGAVTNNVHGTVGERGGSMAVRDLLPLCR